MGQGRMSNLVITQSNIDTYAQYWTYLDDVADSNKEALREGLEQPPTSWFFQGVDAALGS